MTTWRSQITLYIFIICCCLQLPHPVFSNQICRSLEIRSLQDFALLRNCTIIVGHVSIINVQLPPPTETHDNLSSAVVEISDYLLVYRAHGLTSLQQIFPQLVIIRGKELLFEKYSLVVHENRDLVDLGLTSLLRIQLGGIRIEANPVLCFVDTVNWVQLLGNSTSQHFFLKNNKSPNYCPLCPSESGVSNIRHCWNQHTAQQQLYEELSTAHCPRSCGSLGCDTNGGCCTPSCLTGCSYKGCRVCANYRSAVRCMDACNFPFYELNKSECVPYDFCRQHRLIPYAGVCSERCPTNYQMVYDTNGSPTCSPLCSGTFIINSAADLNSVKDCTSIRGSLIVELKEFKTHIIIELERLLTGLKEITGYLQIIRSPQLVSLNFLHSLDTIGGDELIDDKYALYIVDNHHLEQIWAANQKVAILKGRVYFHLNPRLCHDKIMQLETSLKNATKISIVDASPNSNGERVICGSSVRQLNATVEEFNATAALIKVDPMSADDLDVLIGYLHHYKEAPLRNVTMYDGRHGCGHDNWRMDITPSQNVRHIIGNLKPFTQYAYFVKTLTRTDYHMQIDAYSKIQYFGTLPSKPGPVAKIYFNSVSATEIMVHWWPPKNPNGLIKQYLVFYEVATPQQQNATKQAKNYPTQTRPKNSLDVCQCSQAEPVASGPMPEDENYYNKEQITYDEALPNLIYVPRIAELPKNHVYKKKIPAADNTTNTDNNNTSRAKRKSDNFAQEANQIDKSFKDQDTAEHTKNSSDNEIEDNDTKAQRIYSRYRQEMEQKALRQQDNGKNNFPIIKPQPTCSVTNPSVQYQLENLCKPLEQYPGIAVSGQQHSYLLQNLTPEQTYLISVRACVDGLENGCGCESTILAQTVTKRMETFLKEFHAFN